MSSTWRILVLQRRESLALPILFRELFGTRHKFAGFIDGRVLWLREVLHVSIRKACWVLASWHMLPAAHVNTTSFRANNCCRICSK